MDLIQFKLKIIAQDKEVIVWLVDGQKIRDHIDSDYTEGGHYYRYNWIPENEIFIENMLEKDDQIFDLIHEYVERYFMKYKGLTYDQAHDIAKKFEDALRYLLEVYNGK